MTVPPPGAPGALPLPDEPSLEWLKKAAKDRLAELRKARPEARLADAQLELARAHGFASWRALKAHIDGLTLEGRLFDAAGKGDTAGLAALLDQHPHRLLARKPPYEHTLLHVAAQRGHLPVVELLLARGVDPNVRERGDNTYPMHWAAAAGHAEVVRRLADAGGDVVGSGDDHQLEVIGWATCWDGTEDDAHRAVVDVLLARGARHHIFSAVAWNLAGEVRRIVAEDPATLNQRMSRNENHRLPLQHAVRMNRPAMVTLLVELGADPLGVDGDGMPAAAYGFQPGTDRAVMEKIRALTAGELLSAERGHRQPRIAMLDLLAAVSLGDWPAAERLVRAAGKVEPGPLHLMAKRGDVAGVKWLLAHGADPNARWAHWDSDVVPLHMAIMEDHPDVVPVLLAAGANPLIRDTKHDADAIGWAEFFGRIEMRKMLTTTD